MNQYKDTENRAKAIAESGSLSEAVASGRTAQFQDLSMSEALILGLLNQGVRKYVGIFGHGSTDLGNILSRYEQAGLVKMYNVRHETEAAHCVTMLKWHYGETAAVVTSIGPGALHAFSGSLASASNGIGVYHIYGDETTHDEGPNMQQVPKPEQANFLNLVKTMGAGYQIHTPESVFTALRRGAAEVFNPFSPGPFFLLLPMNIQPALLKPCNLLELPQKPNFSKPSCTDAEVYKKAGLWLKGAERITIKIGGGAANCGPELIELAELTDAVIVEGAKMPGHVPASFGRNMGVGGSKGSICGNHAMNRADLAIIVGAREVCQWDCSGTAWKEAKRIINFNTLPHYAGHYNNSIPILGEAKQNLRHLIDYLKQTGWTPRQKESEWYRENKEKKAEWKAFKALRYENPVLVDPRRGIKLLTQPAAVHIACGFAVEKRAARYFDAGDIQANGFQITEDEEPGFTFSDTGASYMGLAASGLLCSALADKPVYTFAFSGDGSFTMNPQILIDAVEHGVKGCLIIFDNRGMGAIIGLQWAQYGRDYKTTDSVEVDYSALAASVKGVNSLFGGYSPESFRAALEEAYEYPGLSVVTVPVYLGEDELGGLGAFGNWNVGNWCTDVQKEHHRIGL